MTQESQKHLPRYKIGYRSDEWGMGGSTLTGIPSPDGVWVRYEDAQAVATGYAAARLEIESLQARAKELGKRLEDDRFPAAVYKQAFYEAHSKVECLKVSVQELEAQLDAVGAGGMELLRKSNSLESGGIKNSNLSNSTELEASQIAAHGITNHETGCGACGDGCKSRGSCQLADESPEQQAKAAEGVHCE